MATILWYALARYRGQVLGWSVGLFLIGWPAIAMYDTVKSEQDRIREVARHFEAVIAGMGGDVDNLASPPSYLSMRYFSHLPLILGIFAVLAGSGLLAADVQN